MRMPLYDLEETSRELLSDTNMLGNNTKEGKGPELSLFNFESLAKATNNFHDANKLVKYTR